MFEAAPLELLFPGVAAADVARLRVAVSVLDSGRPEGSTPRWHWMVEHAVFPESETAGIPVVLCTAVTMDDRAGDWAELELDVSWTRDGQLEVTAQVGVACWCEVNHNTHYVDRLTALVGGDRPLARAFERAVDQMVVWLAGPSDPFVWRAGAGLPSPGR